MYDTVRNVFVIRAHQDKQVVMLNIEGIDETIVFLRFALDAEDEECNVAMYSSQMELKDFEELGLNSNVGNHIAEYGNVSLKRKTLRKWLRLMQCIR